MKKTLLKWLMYAALTCTCLPAYGQFSQIKAGPLTGGCGSGPQLGTDTLANKLYICNTGHVWEPLADAASTGDVTGPASSTPNNGASFADGTGRILLDSGVGLSGGVATGQVHDKGGQVYNILSYTAASGNTAAANVAATNLAISDACATGGTVVIPPSTGPFLVTPPNTTKILTVPAGCTLTLTGGGTLKVADAAGDFDTFLGTLAQQFGDLVVDGITIDYNTAGNPYTAITHPREFIQAQNTSLSVTVVNTRFANTDSQALIYTAAPRNIVQNNRIGPVGGLGSFYHDFSAIDVNANDGLIDSNSIWSRGVNTPGATSAIETHGGHITVTSNVIDSMYNGMNVTGIASTASVGTTITGNAITHAYHGIYLWSQISSGHNSGFGLDEVVTSNNTIRLNQSAWTTAPDTGLAVDGATLGIACQPTPTLPIRGWSAAGNVIIFDLETAAGPPPQNTFSMGLGCKDNGGTATPILYDAQFNGNTIVNAPAPGIMVIASYQNVQIANNHIVNAGSSGNSGLSTAYRDGIFIAPPTSGQCEGLRTHGNDIYDNQTTSTLVRGIYALLPTGCTDHAFIGDTVSVKDATHTSFLFPFTVTNFTPLLQMSVQVNSFGTGLVPVHAVNVGSYINDLKAGGVWWTQSNGTSWLLNSSPFSTAAVPILFSTCAGAVSSNATMNLYPLAQTTATCSTATGSNAGIAIGAHTFGNLRCNAAVASGNTNGGVCSIFDSSSATTCTCTLGTSTSCTDLVHMCSLAVNHFLSARVQSAGGRLTGTGPTYASGSSACTNGTQTVTFTNNTSGTLAVNATGTITITAGVPVGNVTIVTPGSGYAASTPPTAGTISTCTGAAAFTGGTVTVDAMSGLSVSFEETN